MYKISSWNIFWHKRKINHFDPYSVFLAIATNIPQRLKVLCSRVTYVDSLLKQHFLSMLVSFCGNRDFFFFLKILILELDGNELEVQKSIY